MESIGLAIDDLTPNQVRAIQALATAKTFVEAAEKAGVSRDVIRQWLNTDDSFRLAYRAVKAEAFEELALAMVQLGKRAVEAWHRVLDNPSANGSGILSRTASDIVGHLLKLRETMELEVRIEALERFQSGGYIDV